MAQDNQAEIATETRASSAKKRALQEKNVEAPERPAITAMRQAGETAVEIAVNDAFRPGARWFFSTLGGTGGVLVGLWLGKQVGITTPLTR